MKTIAQSFGSLLAAVFLFAGASAQAAPPSEIHIMPDGTFSANNVIVMQKAGTADFFCRVAWGNAFVRVTVLAHGTTVITKNHGEAAQSNDIQAGDILDVSGTLSPSDGTLVIDALQIRDSSLQLESKTISGVIQSISADHASFVLPNTAYGNTVVVLSATTTIEKGVRTLGQNDVAVGDKVLAVSGIYDYTTNTLSASGVMIYQDKSVFWPHNFQGTLKSLSGTALPATLVVTVGGIDYTVYLSGQTGVVNKARNTVGLSRYVVGDTVRFYGAIRQTNLTEVDAVLVRDINF